MSTEVILPKVDMDMVTGRISKWFAEEGATVAMGDALFEIETDKAAMDIEAPASGVLSNVVGEPGVDIAVGTAVAWIFAEGEQISEAPDTACASENAPVGRDVEKPRATPLARRLAKAAAIDLVTVTGSGPRGRIVSADIERQAPQQPAAPDMVIETGRQENDLPFDDGTYDLVPHSAMRRTIARRLVTSIDTVPHFFLNADCRIDALLKLRRELNASAPEVAGAGEPGAAGAWKISVNDMVIKALAGALDAVPEANVTWSDDAMARHHNANVGVAVSVPGGLLTPIIRKAETKSLSAISREVRELATRAQNHQLAPSEYHGGVSTVSNLGMHGVERFAAIINPPQSTILAVGRGERRPVFADDSDEVTAVNTMAVTLSADHRAVDGVLAARLLAVFKALMEEPLRLVV